MPKTAQVRCAAGRGFEVDLHDLAGGVAAHHHVEEHRLLEGQGNLEQGVVVDERDIDAAGVTGVGVHHLITARCWQRRVHPFDETVDHENGSRPHTHRAGRVPGRDSSRILTLVFGIVFITDFFDGSELQLVGVYAFILLMGILDIFTDDYHDSPAYKKALREAKPRRVLISDDEQPIISIRELLNF